MADLSEFGIDVRLFLTMYPWRRIDPVPWTQLTKPLAQCKLALVSTGAFALPDQVPFAEENTRGGDFSYRMIPADVDPAVLVDCHPSDHYDHSGLAQDRNVAFPLDRVHELAAQGRIAAVNHRHLSFCGAILAPGRLTKHTAPEAARQLVADGVDVALLCPV